ncbi:MAG: MBL fold metallo-hydrolase [Bacteroidetes bacterium]|nr:MBL fold metallo-hydrolase [Bacteroidota bacterium]
MRLATIDTGMFKLDGGAMFGVVPKSIWNKINPADENNLCSWALRCLFVEIGDHRILIDTGLGNKQSEKFFSYYEPHGEDSLEGSLNKLGVSMDDITDVVHSHFHFDHCGGTIITDADGKFSPAFKNANLWTSEEHWNWATNPNAREKASFLGDNILPMKESGQLKLAKDGEEIFPGFRLKYVHGHTEAMMIPHINFNGKTLVYMADLLPSVGHIPLPYIMGYDIRPMITLEEKTSFLEEAVANEYILYFEHDPVNECCTLKQEDNRIKRDEIFKLSDLSS